MFYYNQDIQTSQRITDYSQIDASFAGMQKSRSGGKTRPLYFRRGIVKADQNARKPDRGDIRGSSVSVRNESRYDPRRHRARKAGYCDHRLDPDDVPGRYFLRTGQREPGPGVHEPSDADREGIRGDDLYCRTCDERGRGGRSPGAGTYGGRSPLF